MLLTVSLNDCITFSGVLELLLDPNQLILHFLIVVVVICYILIFVALFWWRFIDFQLSSLNVMLTMMELMNVMDSWISGDISVDLIRLFLLSVVCCRRRCCGSHRCFFTICCTLLLLLLCSPFSPPLYLSDWCGLCSGRQGLMLIKSWVGCHSISSVSFICWTIRVISLESVDAGLFRIPGIISIDAFLYFFSDRNSFVGGGRPRFRSSETCFFEASIFYHSFVGVSKGRFFFFPYDSCWIIWILSVELFFSVPSLSGTVTGCMHPNIFAAVSLHPLLPVLPLLPTFLALDSTS